MSDFSEWPELASRGVGGTVVATNDELFASADNLINDSPAAHDRGAFGPRGKIYDGWETRRRREHRHAGPDPFDWVIIRLGAPAVLYGVIVDTSFFTGNFPSSAAVEGATVLDYARAEQLPEAAWVPLLTRTELKGDSANAFDIVAAQRLITHVRLRIYPDGGVSRLRVHGEVVPDPRFLGGRVDLAATTNGGRIIGCSNMFYSSPANVLAPGKSRVMSDGWETSRRRDSGNDWLSVSLAAPAVLHDVVIDTSRFVGNAPREARLTDLATNSELLGLTPLLPDTEHRFRLQGDVTVSELRLDVYPDGGLSRLRLHGEVAPAARDTFVQRWLSLLPQALAETIDHTAFFD